MSLRSIQSTMSSRSITIVSSGRSTGLEYKGNLLYVLYLLVLFPIIPFFFFFFWLCKPSKLIFATWVCTLVLCYQGWGCTTLSSPHSPNSRWRRTGSPASAPPLTSAAALRATTNIPIITPTHLPSGRQTDSLKRKVQELHGEENHTFNSWVGSKSDLKEYRLSHTLIR